MKPINAEEIVRVFNGWLEEADSLAEREAIECCMKFVKSGYDLKVIEESV